MFCQIKSFSSCKDIEKIKRTLFLTDKYGDNWLEECCVSLSGCGSLLALARGPRVCLLTTHWDSSANASNFALSWSDNQPSDVTALLVFPVSYRGQASQGSSDWICVVVGHRSGHVGFYTEHGQLVLWEHLHEAPVLQLKCHQGPQHSADTDELHVLYAEAVCCLSAGSLLQTLAYRRTQLSKGGSVSDLADGQSVMARKLGFGGQDVVCDAAVIGLELSNTFDHLVTASTHGGFFTGFRSVAPHNTLVVGVGARPYLGFHQALEGGNTQPLLHDVARAVASKIKSALPGWLGGGGGSSSSSAPVAPPLAAERMLLRWALSDLRRRGLSAAISPDRRLLAVLDSLGRVMVVDARRGTAIRMFKGYRDGQCGFLQVYEDTYKNKGTGRRALFLVLYVAKRGHLEVWPLRGPRIAAFTAAQHARLLTCSAGLLQQPSTSRRPRANTSLPAVTLLDPDGQLKHIVVPFHFSLSNENSDRARDVHLVKRLRQLIKDKECHEQLRKEVVNTTRELKTIDIKTHCLEMMAVSRHVSPDLLLTCIQMLKVDNNGEESTAEGTKLKNLQENLYSLIRFFMNINDIEYADESCEADDETNEGVADVETEDDVQRERDEEVSIECKDNVNNESESKDNNKEQLFVTEEEMENLQQLLNLAESVQHKKNLQQKVTFVEDSRSLHSDFISVFDTYNSADNLKLKEPISQDSLHFVSRQIFDHFIVGKSDWRAMIMKCDKLKKLLPGDLCKLLFVYWMALPVHEMTHGRMEKFGAVLLEICRTEGFDKVYVGYSDTSPWWKSVRDFLVEASCPFRSMVSAQLCRAVAQRIEKEEDQNGSEFGVWESVSKDNAQWGLLIGKLDDISLLSIVLSQKLEASNKLPRLFVELPEINLKYIYNSGKGSISELTAKWLCTAGVDPVDIIQHYSDQTDPEHDKKTESDSSKKRDRIMHVGSMSFFDKLSLLRRQFPLSLNIDCLVVNMCWEYSKCWQKNIEELQFLEAMLHCLRSISHVQMKCGICCMIWSTHLIFTFEAAYKLISKVGKLPREKLSRQNVGMSDSQLLKFLEIVTDFFEVLLSSALSCGEKEVAPVRYENIWEESSSALTELALNNAKINIDVLQVHYEVCLVIYYQCYLGSNFWKHLTYLFNVDSQRCMFGSLKASGGSGMFGHQSTDSRVALQRARFLSRLVHKCTELAVDQGVWLDRILDLARIWRLDGDHVRREHVVRLYSQGMDPAAEAALSSVADPQPLVDILVPLAGRRLKHFIEDADNRAEILAVLPPVTTSYLQSLEDVSDEVAHVSDLLPIQRLVTELMARGQKDDNSQRMRTAGMLLDACITLQEHLGITH